MVNIAEAAKDIWHAKLAVMQEVPYVQKHGQLRKRDNSLLHTYASEADLLRKIRPALLEHGIIWGPRSTEIIPGPGIRLLVTYVFRHVPSGTEDSCVIATEGSDTFAAGKANTYAHKYALKTWLAIETGDDPDREVPNSEAFRAATEAIRAAPNAEALKKIGVSIKARQYSPEERDTLLQEYVKRAQEVGLRLRQDRRVAATDTN